MSEGLADRFVTKEALASAVSADFGNRSPDETYAAVLSVMASIKRALAHLQEWMAPQAKRWVGHGRPLHNDYSTSLGSRGRDWARIIRLAPRWAFGVGIGRESSAGKAIEETPRTAQLIREILENDVGADVSSRHASRIGRCFADCRWTILFTGSPL